MVYLGANTMVTILLPVDCSVCGEKLLIGPNVRTFVCAFCNNEYLIHRYEDTVELERLDETRKAAAAAPTLPATIPQTGNQVEAAVETPIIPETGMLKDTEEILHRLEQEINSMSVRIRQVEQGRENYRKHFAHVLNFHFINETQFLGMNVAVLLLSGLMYVLSSSFRSMIMPVTVFVFAVLWLYYFVIYKNSEAKFNRSADTILQREIEALNFAINEKKRQIEQYRKNYRQSA